MIELCYSWSCRNFSKFRQQMSLNWMISKSYETITSIIYCISVHTLITAIKLIFHQSYSLSFMMVLLTISKKSSTVWSTLVPNSSTVSYLNFHYSVNYWFLRNFHFHVNLTGQPMLILRFMNCSTFIMSVWFIQIDLLYFFWASGLQLFLESGLRCCMQPPKIDSGEKWMVFTMKFRLLIQQRWNLMFFGNAHIKAHLQKGELELDALRVSFMSTQCSWLSQNTIKYVQLCHATWFC